MFSAASLLPQPEATKRHKHQASSASRIDSSTQLPTKPEAAAILDNRWSNGNGYRVGDAEVAIGDPSRLNEKHLPRLSIPSPASAPLPGGDVGHLQSNSGGGVQVNGVPYGAEDPRSYSTGYYCGSDIEKQSEHSHGVYSEEGHGLPQTYQDTAMMNTSDELTESERDIDQHLKSILVSILVRLCKNRADIRPE
ncbi:hypothetical protein MMC18_002490 [Xylographa bjoerkii]|nr:hypothetical protein [Xylographa bjoerkii]